MHSIVIAIIIALAIILFSYSLLPTEYMRLKNFLKNKKRSSDKVIYLTFDDGPDSRYTPELLNLLDEYNIKASFFIVASAAKNNPEIIEEMVKRGHMVGFHSFDHKNLLIDGPISTYKKINKSIEIMDDIGVRPTFFRAPWGINNIVAMKETRKAGMKRVLWSVMAEDWSGRTTSEIIAKKLRRRVRNGSVICLHDGRGTNGAPARTISALRMVLPEWKSKGYSFVRIDER